MGEFSIGAKVIITEDSPLKGRTGTITGVSKTSEHIMYVQLRDGGAHIPVGDQEMRAASQQCKDCDGEGGSYFNGWYWDKCPTCDGTGTIHRTGPYRLADGTWSDGVDRHIELADREPTLNRWEVWQDDFGDWVASCGRTDECDSLREDFPPGAFAEAIAYADRTARTTKNGDAM